MNRTITTTSTTRRRGLRLRLRHAALALCAVLMALVAASCTADALDGTDPGAPSPGNTYPADVLTFAVGPRPGFTEAAATRGTDTKAAAIEQEIAGQARNDKKSARNDRGEGAAPATRAELADNATRWEQGDILWLDVTFYQDKQDISTLDTVYFSALKYDANEWRYLTQAEAEGLNTGNIPRFSRLVRWPRGSEDWVDPGISIYAWYAGSGKPDADGTITIIPTGEIPTTPFIGGGNDGICSPDGKPVPLKLGYYCSRIRIPAGYKVELTKANYWGWVKFSPKSIIPSYAVITEIPAQSEATDVFLDINNRSTAKLIRDNVSYTFTFPETTNAVGLFMQAGASYTLTPYTSGAETPGGYDLTVATETDLRALARAVNAGDRLPNGKPAREARVLQTADIELTQEWVPIGYSRPNRFRGAYNGNGHEITGLTIKTMPQPGADQGGVPASCAGLFGYAEGAVLTGIRLRKVGINITDGSGGSALRVGSIAGTIENSTLSLCTTNGTMNADGGGADVYAGGIAGDSWYSTISRCRADVEIKAAATKGNANAYAGGIAGYNGTCSFILSCESGDGAVTAEGSGRANAGGITGRNIASSLIAFCRTGTNAVKAQNGTDVNYAGGLVGENVSYLYSCYSRAVATAAGSGIKRAGAIVGYNYEQEQVQHCYAAGATDQGTSNLATGIGIVYKAIPDPGEIFGVMTNYPGEVESLTGGGKTYYPFTTSYAPSATPAYGIIPRRAVWKSDGAWNIGDGTYPKLNIEEYEGK